MKITDAIDRIQITMENSDVFIIDKGSTLSETREAFLELMGREFDNKFYEALKPEEKLSTTKGDWKNLNELKAYLYDEK